MAQQNHFYKNNQFPTIDPHPSHHPQQPYQHCNHQQQTLPEQDGEISFHMLSHHIARLTTEGYDNLKLVQENIRIESAILTEIDRISKFTIQINSHRPQKQDTTSQKHSSRQLQLLSFIKHLSTHLDRQSKMLKLKSKSIVCLARLLKGRTLQLQKLKEKLQISKIQQEQLRSSLSYNQTQVFSQPKHQIAQKVAIAAEDIQIDRFKTVSTQQVLLVAGEGKAQLYLKENEAFQSQQIATKVGLLKVQTLVNQKINPTLFTFNDFNCTTLNEQVQTKNWRAVLAQTQQPQTTSSVSQTDQITLQTLNQSLTISKSIQTEKQTINIFQNRGDSTSIRLKSGHTKYFSFNAVISWQWEGQSGVKIETQITEEDQTLSKFSFVSHNSNEELLSYIKEISHFGSEVDYNEEAIRSLQNMGQENQVSRAFARLLKENKCLRVCLNKLIDNEREQEERNNSRIFEILQQSASPNSDNSKQSQCSIY